MTTSDNREHGEAASGSWAIEACSLVKRYRGSAQPALDGLDLMVRQGTFFGLLGPNGAGKTTAISILTGLLDADAGEARIMGMPLGGQARRIKALLGLVPQQIGLYNGLSARENLFFFGRLLGLSGNVLDQRVEEALAFANLREHAGRPVAGFSFGMKRRLNLAAGLLHQPQLLVLDEPCVGVDAQSRHLIHRQLHELNRSGTTILYTTHYMEEAQELCQRVGIIDRGRLVEEGEPAALLRASGMANLEELFLQRTGKELRDAC